MNKIIGLTTITVLLVSALSFTSCENDTSISAPVMDEQGLFMFLGDALDEEKEELPDYIKEEDVLCFGKGLRVGRCISKQLATGKCLGLIKLKKKVVAVEVPCESMAQPTQVVAEE